MFMRKEHEAPISIAVEYHQIDARGIGKRYR